MSHLHSICHNCHKLVEFDDGGNKLTAEEAFHKFIRLINRRTPIIHSKRIINRARKPKRSYKR